MNNEPEKKGYSLTEVLLALVTLSLGMICIAGVFPVALHYTTTATERTIAATVADEAFAKIRLMAGDPVLAQLLAIPPAPDRIHDYFVDSKQRDFGAQLDQARGDAGLLSVSLDLFVYPSDGSVVSQAQYCWAALCRRMSPLSSSSDMQVTVFVCRKAGGASLPAPVDVEVTGNMGDLFINVTDPDPLKQTAIGDGVIIVENSTGQMYRVVSRDTTGLVTLDPRKAWGWTALGLVWVIPPPVDGGRNPCIAVYQRVIRF